MTNRNRNTGKIETTIELFRTDGKWLKVIELAEELKAGSPNNCKTNGNDCFNLDLDRRSNFLSC